MVKFLTGDRVIVLTDDGKHGRGSIEMVQYGKGIWRVQLDSIHTGKPMLNSTSFPERNLSFESPLVELSRALSKDELTDEE